MTDDTKPLSDETVEQVVAILATDGWAVGDTYQSLLNRVLVAHSRELAARDATIERLRAALRESVGLKPSWGVAHTVGQLGTWEPSNHITHQPRCERFAWCARANRYEQLTGEKSDG